ncbi:MAG: hypothetical protein NWR52_04460, partial [Paracoccaceae bacterium]|nr:hypothetical protein [Paracoccaceae bacterium]
FLIVLYLPVLFIPLFSFNDSIYVRFPMQGLTIQWYVDLWTRESVWAALQNSLTVGLWVSVISTGLGVVAARAITRYRMPGQSAIVTFAMLPLIVPGVIFGVALLVLVMQIVTGLWLAMSYKPSAEMAFGSVEYAVRTSSYNTVYFSRVDVITIAMGQPVSAIAGCDYARHISPATQ